MSDFNAHVKKWESWIMGTVKDLTKHEVETLVTRKFISSIGEMKSHEGFALQTAEDNVLKKIEEKQIKSL